MKILEKNPWVIYYTLNFVKKLPMVSDFMICRLLLCYNISHRIYMFHNRLMKPLYSYTKICYFLLLLYRFIFSDYVLIVMVKLPG